MQPAEGREPVAERPPAPSPASPAHTLIRGPRAKLYLAVLAGAVLGLGSAMAPREIPQPTPKERVAPMLEAAVERREPARFFRSVQEAGNAALAHGVAFRAREPARPQTAADFGAAAGAQPAPAAFGLLVEGGLVLTHVAALGGSAEPTAELADGTEVIARVQAYEAESGLVLLQVARKVGGARLALVEPLPGALTVAAGRFDDNDFVMPLFVGGVGPHGYTLTTSGGLLPPGTPIYDLGGEALAVASGSTSLAHPVGEALDRLQRLAGEGRGMPRTIGVCLQAVTPALAGSLGAAGALVSDVIEGGPAARSGLRAGDVLLGVGGTPLTTPEAARRQIAALTPGRTTQVSVRRQGASREFEVQVEGTLALDPCHQARAAPSGARPAGQVFTSAELAGAGLSTEALVLTVDGRPAAERRPAARRQRDAGRLVHVQEGPRRYFAVVGEAR